VASDYSAAGASPLAFFLADGFFGSLLLALGITVTVH
jgi:hypothetical protein